jgi:hypothetical protein
VKVPWLVVEDGRRREIIAEQKVELGVETQEDIVTERLRQLGYA